MFGIRGAQFRALGCLGAQGEDSMLLLEGLRVIGIQVFGGFGA